MRAAAHSRGVPLIGRSLPFRPDIAELYESRFVLVRPDGHVAWRGDRVPEDALAVIDTVRGAAVSG